MRAAGGAISNIAHAGASVAGGASAAYRAGGFAGVAQAGVSAATSPLRRAASSLGASYASAAQAASPSASTADNNPPSWAQRLNRRQAITHGASAAASALRSGDSAGAGHNVDLSEGE
jgi:type IV secretion system protein TrbL